MNAVKEIQVVSLKTQNELIKSLDAPQSNVRVYFGVLIVLIFAGLVWEPISLIAAALCILFLFSIIALSNPQTGLIIAIMLLPVSQDWIRIQVFNANVTLSYLLTTILFTIWMSRRNLRREKRSLVRLSLYIPMIAFLIVNMISVVLSTEPETGIKNIIKLIYYFVLFLLIANLILSYEDLFRLIRSWFFSTIVFSLVAICFFISPYMPPSDWIIDLSKMIMVATRPLKSGQDGLNRLALGFGTGWVESAIFPMIGILVMMCASFRQVKLNRLKGLNLAFVLLLVTTLLLTYSRGGWISTLTGLSIILLLTKAGIRRLLLIISIIIAIFFLAPSSMIDRFLLIPEGDISRTTLWEESWNFLLQRPLFGIGPAMISSYLAPFAATLGWAEVDSTVLPHNVFLTYWVEIGTIGFLVLLWLIFSTIGSAIKARQVLLSTRPEWVFVLEMLLAIMAAMIVFGVTTIRYADWFWVFLALLSVANRLAFVKDTQI
jgi:O-antigen ligase